MKTRKKFPPEIRERAVRMVFEQRAEHDSQWVAIQSIAPKRGCSAQTLCNWVRQYERDTGQRDGITTEEAARIKALEQALWARRPTPHTLIHHSDRGSQYVSIRYSERLIREGIKPSVGSVGDSYDNALAESLIGLYKAELVHRRGPWKSGSALELATLHWVSWFNEHRLLEPIGYIPPAEAETNYFRNRGDQTLAA